MGNHYHLLLETPRANLSRIMRHIDGLYTQRYNRRKGTDGPLFRGRYKAILIDRDAYLLQVSRYIHRNPIELNKPLVQALKDYPWSSYPAYIGQAVPPAWLQVHTVQGMLDSKQRYRAYRRFVEEGLDAETAAFYRRKQTLSVLGDDGFKQRALKHAGTLDKEVSRSHLMQPISPDTVLQQVAEYCGVQEDELKRAKRGAGVDNLPRWMAMKLCQEQVGMTLKDIAKVFQVGHYSTVSQTIRRLNALMKEDKQLAKYFNVLSQDLTPITVGDSKPIVITDWNYNRVIGTADIPKPTGWLDKIISALDINLQIGTRLTQHHIRYEVYIIRCLFRSCNLQGNVNLLQ